MILVRTVKHLFRSRIYETDVWIGPAYEWRDWPECHSREWQPVWYEELVIAVRPVSTRPDVRPRALGVRTYPEDTRRFRALHGIGRKYAPTEILIRLESEGLPEDSGEPAAWYRVPFDRRHILLCPVLPRPSMRGHRAQALGRRVG